MRINWDREKLKIYWLYALILGFAYERPIVFLGSIDRLNPRIYDLLMVFGIFFFGKDLLKTNVLPIPIKTWKNLIVWFLICALIWSIFLLPIHVGVFSVFFALRYTLGVATLYLVVSTPITQEVKKNIHKLIIFGGVFVAVFSLNQYFNPNKTFELAEGKLVTQFQDIVTGPFGVTYFHIAQFSGLSFIFALNYALDMKTNFKKMIWVGLSFFISWPMFFSGSRTALGYFVLGFILMSIFKLKFLLQSSLVAIVGVFLMLLLGYNSEKLITTENSVTMERLQYSEGHNSISNRLDSWGVDFSSYEYGGLVVPFIGGGFYVAKSSGHYRIGYGRHNNYIFIIEQSGLPGLYLFLLFLYQMVKGTNWIRKYGNDEDSVFAQSTLIFLISTLIISVAGQIFFRGFNSNNMNTYILVVFAISMIPTKNENNVKIRE